MVGGGGGGEAVDLWVRMLCAGAVPVAATCLPVRGRDCVCVEYPCFLSMCAKRASGRETSVTGVRACLCSRSDLFSRNKV